MAAQVARSGGILFQWRLLSARPAGCCHCHVDHHSRVTVHLNVEAVLVFLFLQLNQGLARRCCACAPTGPSPAGWRLKKLRCGTNQYVARSDDCFTRPTSGAWSTQHALVGHPKPKTPTHRHESGWLTEVHLCERRAHKNCSVLGNRPE
jgi:hypothetical protein